VTPRPTATVRHRAGAYPVYIGRGLLADAAALVARHCPGRRVVIVADARVAEAHPPPFEAPVLTFPPGEGSKTREAWVRLTDAMLALGLGRDTAVVSWGGGVAGDLAGFVAATYLRGVPLVLVPTSLLAMLDASIGGKTGVDTPAGKNLVGAFHQPEAVLTDPALLDTLPADERRTGLAEAVKHALIAGAEEFAWLESRAAALREGDPATLDQLIPRSAAVKVGVVEADEREDGLRAVLNAGHTVAHGLEAASGYTLRHGDAVAIGLVAEAAAAERLGVGEPGTAARIATLLAGLGLPVTPPPGLALARALEAMRADKKNRSGAIHCALPARVGVMAPGPAGGWTHPVAPEVLAAALEAEG